MRQAEYMEMMQRDDDYLGSAELTFLAEKRAALGAGHP
jgi:hypothetical protein